MTCPDDACVAFDDVVEECETVDGWMGLRCALGTEPVHKDEGLPRCHRPGCTCRRQTVTHLGEQRRQSPTQRLPTTNVLTVSIHNDTALLRCPAHNTGATLVGLALRRLSAKVLVPAMGPWQPLNADEPDTVRVPAPANGRMIRLCLQNSAR